MNKKGQATIFIILGIVLLLSGGITYYLVGTAAKGEAAAEIIATEVPVEFTQVKNYVEDCIKLSAIKSLTKIGEHGGYIDMEDEFISDRAFYFDPDPTESDALSISDVSFSPIPYWWYLLTENDCEDCIVSTAAPSSIDLTLEEITENIEGQINRYIDLNLPTCINDFEPLTQQNFVFENIGEIETNAFITENDVVFGVKYPFDVRKEASKTEIENFVVRIELDLKEILELALNITTYQRDNQFLEEILLYFIGAYQGIAFDSLPPTYATNEEFSIVIWSKSLVKEMLREKLMVGSINFIDVDRTKDAHEITIDPAYSIFFLDFLDRDFDLKVDFNYLNWPIYFDITPRSGDIIEPHIVTYNPPVPIVQPSQINTYEFFYDVSFPVLVTLTDDKEIVKGIFGNEGYKFMFALEENIRDNINLLQWNLGLGVYEPANYDDEVEIVIEGEAEVIPPNLFCDSIQQVSGEYTLNVFDEVTNDALDSVSVTYGCGTLSACLVGYTQFDEDEEEFIFKDRLPICDGGYIFLRKEGYSDIAIPFTPDFDGGTIPSVSMEPLISKEVNMEKYVMTVPNSCCGSSIPLDATDFVSMSLSKIVNPNNPFDLPNTNFVMFDGSNPDAELTQTINLVPGTYEVRIDYFDNNGLIIEANCKRFCDNYGYDLSDGDPFDLDCTSHDTSPPDPIEVESLPLGGAILNAGTGYWEVTQEDLESGFDTIEFYLIRAPTPTCIDDASGDEESCLVDGGVCIGIDQMSKNEDYSDDFRGFIEPKWI